MRGLECAMRGCRDLCVAAGVYARVDCCYARVAGRYARLSRFSARLGLFV
ncbi:hypothetical protein HNO89_003795 [Sporosarcina luteola]|nr:hypothetical protein [Sporosarcina luteola]